MAYQPTQFQEGGPPGLSAAEMNKLGSQYGEVKSELQKTDGTSDIRPHGSNIADGSVALAKLDPTAKTSPGGTEANRLAVTDSNGAVGRANALRDAGGTYRGATTPGGTQANAVAVTDANGRVGDAGLLRGYSPPWAEMSNLSDVTRTVYNNPVATANTWYTVLSVSGSGRIVLGVAGYTHNQIVQARLTIDGGQPVVLSSTLLSFVNTAANLSLLLLPPVQYRSSIVVEIGNIAAPLNGANLFCELWRKGA